MQTERVSPSQPTLKGTRIPSGHATLNLKYNGSPFAKALAEFGVKLVYDDSMGLLDCFASSQCAVVLAMEADLVSEEEVELKIKKLSKFSFTRVLIAEMTDASNQYVKQLQLELVISGDIKLIPAHSVKDMALLVSQLVYSESHANPFAALRKTTNPIEESIFAFVRSLPGVGEKKAVDLLTKYQSIEALISASEEDLAAIIGKSTARQLHQTLFQL